MRRLFSGLLGPTERQRSEQPESGLFTPLFPSQHLKAAAGDLFATDSGKEAFRAASDLVRSLGIGRLGEGLATRIASGSFSIDQLRGINDHVDAAINANTMQGKIEGTLGALAGLGFGLLGATHARPRRRTFGPSSRKAFGEVGKTKAKTRPVVAGKEPTAHVHANGSRVPGSVLSRSERARNYALYLDLIVLHTGVQLHRKQRRLLDKSLRQRTYKRLRGVALKRHHEAFRRGKNALIAKWEKETGQIWPTYAEDVLREDGKLWRRAGERYDAHHIIEQKYGGPHKWWNLTPARYPEQHQGGIHREPVMQILFRSATNKYE